MMKPDTPKFALVPVEPTEEMLTAATRCTNSGLGRAKPIYRAMISAAPKPDCVGVEEIKRNTDKHFCHEGRTGHYRPTFDEVIDYLASQGFLAVKEKAQERGKP